MSKVMVIHYENRRSTRLLVITAAITLCSRGSACRYDFLCFLVNIIADICNYSKSVGLCLCVVMWAGGYVFFDIAGFIIITL